MKGRRGQVTPFPRFIKRQGRNGATPLQSSDGTHRTNSAIHYLTQLPQRKPCRRNHHHTHDTALEEYRKEQGYRPASGPPQRSQSARHSQGCSKLPPGEKGHPPRAHKGRPRPGAPTRQANAPRRKSNTPNYYVQAMIASRLWRRSRPRRMMSGLPAAAYGGSGRGRQLLALESPV